MALGNSIGRNNGNQQKEFHPTVFSKYIFSNTNGSADQSRIQFSHWAGMLKISILPMIPGTENEFNSKESVSLHISVPVAYILLQEICRYQQDVAEGRTKDFFYGKDTNKGLIGIYTGDYLGYPGKSSFTIMRLNDSGDVISSYGYELKGEEFYFGVRNFKESTKEFDKVFYPDVELELIKMQLQQYIESMTMSQAYACIEAGKFSSDQVYRSMNQIKEALGIKVERKTTGTGDFFRGSSNTVPKVSYDSVSEAIGGEAPDIDDDNSDFDL